MCRVLENETENIFGKKYKCSDLTQYFTQDICNYIVGQRGAKQTKTQL